MTYSNKPRPNDPQYFEPPPMYLVWQHIWEHARQGLDEGQIRHMQTLHQARKRVGYFWSSTEGEEPVFMRSWAIYQWVDEAWTLIHSGEKGDRRADHPLWQEKLKPFKTRAADAPKVHELFEVGDIVRLYQRRARVVALGPNSESYRIEGFGQTGSGAKYWNGVRQTVPGVRLTFVPPGDIVSLDEALRIIA